MKLSTAIMAHPDRKHLLPELHRKLGAPVPVHWDRYGDRWDTGRRALLDFDPDATHHLVIQDDAIPAPGLLKAIEGVLPFVGQHAMCLYAGRGLRRRLRGKAPRWPCWVAMRRIHWGVGIVLPVEDIPAAVQYGDASTIPNYDARLSEYWYGTKRLVLYPLPSWVQHARTPSLVPGRSGRRTALAFAESGVRASDWLVAPTYGLPDWKWGGAGARETSSRGGTRRRPAAS